MNSQYNQLSENRNFILFFDSFQEMSNDGVVKNLIHIYTHIIITILSQFIKIHRLMQRKGLDESSSHFKNSQLDDSLIQKQIAYVEFLQRVLFMLERMQVAILDPPLKKLTQFMVQYRLDSLESKTNKKQRGNHFLLNSAHDQSLASKCPYGLTGSQYCFFTFNHGFHEIIQLQYQAFLRQFIIKVEKALSQIQPQLMSLFKYTIYSLDFVLSLYLIGQDQVAEDQNESQGNWKGHQLRKYAQNPISSEVIEIFKSVRLKLKNLDIIEEFHKARN